MWQQCAFLSRFCSRGKAPPPLVQLWERMFHLFVIIEITAAVTAASGGPIMNQPRLHYTLSTVFTVNLLQCYQLNCKQKYEIQFCNTRSFSMSKFLSKFEHTIEVMYF